MSTVLPHQGSISLDLNTYFGGVHDHLYGANLEHIGRCVYEGHWPGGNFASAYRWKDGICPRDLRPGYLDAAWNTWEPNDMGTDEFMDLCHYVGTAPILTINMGNADAAEAAQWVAYCNAGSDTPMGKLRGANGHSEPYNVKTWFVGNEQFGNWQVGTCDAKTYARRYVEYAYAMLAVDPSLDLIAVGAPTDLYGHWNELVLKTAHGEIKKPSAHSDPPAPIIFDEWNTYVNGKPPDFFEEYGMADAIYTGGLMNACWQRADWIKMSASFNLIYVMGNLRVTPTQVWKTPTALVLELFTKYCGTHSVGCETRSETVATPAAGNLPAYDMIPLLDAAATVSEGGGDVYLSVVNREPDRAAQIDVSGIARSATARVHYVQGDSPQAMNTEAAPEAVMIEQAEWSEDAPLSIPAHTVVVIEIPLENILKERIA